MPTRLKAIFIVLLTFCLMGCVPMSPYRSGTVASHGNGCSGESGAQGKCPIEHTENYDLFFVEFDDQGMLHDATLPENGDASLQIEVLNQRLESIVKEYPSGISLVVYVHGWRHDAAPGDSDVREFKKLLLATKSVETSNRRIVGVFVGWRGKSTDLEPFQTLSFWSRKFAAQRVAIGSPRELFARLKNLQRRENEKCSKAGTCSAPQVRMVMIGHSFGGLILYNAISPFLLDSAITDETGEEDAPTISRYGDLIILLNPAFEATRYAPLHQVITKQKYLFYPKPVFVSVTSEADWATGKAFPLGRFFNTILEHESTPEQHEANNNTIGHVKSYITHTLAKGAFKPWCENNLEEERKDSNKDRDDETPLPEKWSRQFCGGALLTHVQHDPNSPVWNIRADKNIMGGHNDVSQSVLWSFLRQIYHELN